LKAKYSILIALMFFMVVCSALATPIVSVTGIYSAPVGGVYTYNYTVSVLSGSESVWQFWIYPGGSFTNVSQIIEPPDNVLWDNITMTDLNLDPYIQWYALDYSGVDDIKPGNSLSGFSYDSTVAPGLVYYEVFGSGEFVDPTMGYSMPTPDYSSGTILVEPIPEPSTILLLGGGLLGLLGAGILRRRDRL